MTVVNGIANLDTVEPGVFRGGQPDGCGWDWLKTSGVHTVIKLNTEGEGSDAQAEALGLNVVRFPIPWWRQTIFRPRSRDLHAAVGIITSRIAPVFVHCTHGQDRTGLVIGCLRLAQRWSKDEAYAEMRRHDFHLLALQGLQGCWEAQRTEDWV